MLLQVTLYTCIFATNIDGSENIEDLCSTISVFFSQVVQFVGQFMQGIQTANLLRTPESATLGSLQALLAKRKMGKDLHHCTFYVHICI